MIVLIDKPKGWTSFDVVAKVRGILKEKKVGHAGTLDPNATGLLIIGTGADTKKLGDITKNTNKVYEAEITLGESRTTDDVAGETVRVASQNFKKPETEEIKKVLKEFEGEQMQIPPQFSAIKQKGKKAYDMARNGETVKFEPRKVNVYKVNFVSYKYPILKVVFDVSSGTYIRSLARDIGVKLGTFAYLNELRRTQVGEYKVRKAITLQELQKLPQEEQLQH